MVDYRVISSGSKGNAVVLEREVLIDCGVPFKALKEDFRNLKLVLLTHIHSDHFHPRTISALAKMRPTLRFGCGPWLAESLVKAGVSKSQIDILEAGYGYTYPCCKASPVMLAHNVPNFGYKLFFPGGRVFYATDTGNLEGIKARGYDLYMVEANYEDDEIMERIAAKREAGLYAYETEALKNHLSKKQCDDFIYSNIGPNGRYVYLHQHEGR